MIEALKKKYALSDQGAKDLFKGIVYSVLANVSLMFPVILLAVVLNRLLAPLLGMVAQGFSTWFYTGIGILPCGKAADFAPCLFPPARPFRPDEYDHGGLCKL